MENFTQKMDWGVPLDPYKALQMVGSLIRTGIMRSEGDSEELDTGWRPFEGGTIHATVRE